MIDDEGRPNEMNELKVEADFNEDIMGEVCEVGESVHLVVCVAD